MITYYEAISQEVGGRSTIGLFGFHWLLALALAPFGSSLLLAVTTITKLPLAAIIISTVPSNGLVEGQGHLEHIVELVYTK